MFREKSLRQQIKLGFFGSGTDIEDSADDVVTSNQARHCDKGRRVISGVSDVGDESFKRPEPSSGLIRIQF